MTTQQSNGDAGKTFEQDHFKNLTTEHMLTAVESCGLRCTGRVMQLNSMENRVYAIEVEHADPTAKPYQVIVKFYRPGRWSADEILSEHLVQLILTEEDIPTPKFYPITKIGFGVQGTIPMSSRLKEEVRANIDLPVTLGKIEDFYFCVWEKISGRVPLELTKEHLREIGSTVARMHNLFESHVEPKGFVRPTLSASQTGQKAYDNLKAWGRIPRPLDRAVFALIEDLMTGLAWIDDCTSFIPTHGDLHRLNLMQTSPQGNFWVVDFDDCLWAPDIQDLWLLASGCDLPPEPSPQQIYAQQQAANSENGENGDAEDHSYGPALEEEKDPTTRALNVMLEGYEKFRSVPEGSDLLVEPLRTLRMIHYFGWIAGRWNDPLFQSVFGFFNESSTWERMLNDLEQQKEKLHKMGLLSDPTDDDE